MSFLLGHSSPSLLFLVLHAFVSHTHYSPPVLFPSLRVMPNANTVAESWALAAKWKTSTNHHMVYCILLLAKLAMDMIKLGKCDFSYNEYTAIVGTASGDASALVWCGWMVLGGRGRGNLGHL
ncbi:hypothetical protein BDQ17DRAFT_1330584 [Cyathus striatus]|nr:hypothetical protein BDQ17DRAFT_1330584 [Cyathus striatus]